MTILPSAPLGSGHHGSRWMVNTPGLILDLDALDFNIARMMEAVRPSGRQLRPHAKSHKCPAIAKAQTAAGAVGICCATLDEAAVMLENGVENILLTSPITTAEKIAWFCRLARGAPGLMLVVDHPDIVRALASAARAAGVEIGVLVDIDVGFARTGTATAEATESLVRLIASERGLVFRGLQAYGGHLQHITDYAARLDLCAKVNMYVSDIVARLAAIGFPPTMVSGGGTGTHAIDLASSPFTEIQAGSYVFMDAEYEGVDFDANGAPWPFRRALFVQTAVISVNSPGLLTTDGGTKAFALNGPGPRLVSQGFEGATYAFCGDEHGRVRLAPATAMPPPGTRLECLTPHCDPTVALYDYYNCVRGDAVVGRWQISARGRS